MKIIFNAKWVLLACLVMSTAILSSCKKDKSDVSSKIELLSFGPTGARHGDTLRFIGHNLDKVTEISLTGANVTSSAFISQTPELILIIVPQSTEQGFVTLKTPAGDIISKTRLNLEVPVTVTSITASARPGENITIKGTYLNWVTAVTFAKDKWDTNFVSKSMTEIVIKVPMDAQTGKLVLSTGGTEPLEVETDSSLNVVLPMAAGLAPDPVLHASNLTITGTNLDLVKGIIFPGLTLVDTVFVSQSSTQIVVKVPGATVRGKLTLVAHSGVTTMSSNEFSVSMPVITGLPLTQIEPESNFTITGTNLNLVTGIKFNSVEAPVKAFVSQSPTQLVVKAPAGAKKGKLIFSVLNSTLTVESPGFLTFVGDLPPLESLAYAMYEDDLVSPWQDWGWDRVADYKSTEQVRDGNAAMKVTYSGEWKGMRFANGEVSTGAYSQIAFSVYGTAGTGGKKLTVTADGNTKYEATIQEGKWVEFKLTKEDLGNPAQIKELLFQNQGWVGTIYLDKVGLR